jgi:hypothetical protein
MKALQIYAGPRAREHLARHGLSASDVTTIPAAAGGPKGLILGPLDRFLFGQWLPSSAQPIDLVGASIGAWRMSTACLDDPVAGFMRLENDYIHQHYELPPGQKKVTANQVSETFGKNLQDFYAGRVEQVLQHPRFRLHIVTSRGRHLLRTEHALRTPLGYFGAFATNAIHRKAMGAWLERVVFSAPGPEGMTAPLPFGTHDYRTRQVALELRNFNQALQASCSIPFVLRAVHDIPGGPPGAYWDGGITDYHLHLDYQGAEKVHSNAINTEASSACSTRAEGTNGIVLYPHFQKAVVPGWLDKGLRWRHHATRFLDTTVVLAPHPDWVRTLPNGKLPDRTDFTRYGNDLASRVKAWQAATAAAQQLADEFAAWLEKPDMTQVLPL